MDSQKALPLAAADTGIVEFEVAGTAHTAIAMTLTVADGPARRNLQVVVMTPSEARKLALQLLDCADRATAPGGTPRAN